MVVFAFKTARLHGATRYITEAGVEALVGQSVERAVQAADDESAFGNQIDVAALQRWRVSRVLGKLKSGQVGDLNIAGSHLAPTLGCSLEEQSSDVCGGCECIAQAVLI